MGKKKVVQKTGEELAKEAESVEKIAAEKSSQKVKQKNERGKIYIQASYNNTLITVTDEKGNAFYLVRVRTRTATLGEAKLPIIPGMTAEVDLLTGKRTVLSYILKPVLRAKANALHES